MAWTAAHGKLFERLNQEMDNYACSMWDLPGYAVYGKADEIAAMGFCYNSTTIRLRVWSGSCNMKNRWRQCTVTGWRNRTWISKLHLTASFMSGGAKSRSPAWTYLVCPDTTERR